MAVIETSICPDQDIAGKTGGRDLLVAIGLVRFASLLLELMLTSGGTGGGTFARLGASMCGIHAIAVGAALEMVLRRPVSLFQAPAWDSSSSASSNASSRSVSGVGISLRILTSAPRCAKEEAAHESAMENSSGTAKNERD